MKYPVFTDLIIFENDDFIVVNKPPFLATLEDRALNATNLLKLARQYHPDAQACHRLDKETSGALAIAKNPEAYRHLSMQFEHREVTKIYHAVVDGVHEFDTEEVNLPIYTTSHGTVRIDPRGKHALTYFKTVKAFKKHTLIKCMPVTGRLHQIRVHLWALKAPISGDETYGGKPFYLSEIKKRFNLKNFTEEMPLIQRVALHAYSLEFKTLNGKEILVEAPYPKDFSVLVKQLEKYS